MVSVSAPTEANLCAVSDQAHLPPWLAGYSHVDAEYPINSDDQARHSIACWHALATYLHTLDPSVPLDLGCQPPPGRRPPE